MFKKIGSALLLQEAEPFKVISTVNRQEGTHILLLTTADAENFRIVRRVTHCAHVVKAGKGTVEIEPDRRPGQAEGVAGCVAVDTGSFRIVYSLHMAETAGSRPSADGMFAGREIGEYRGVMAGNAEITAAKRGIIVEGVLADGAATERPRMPAGVGADMTLEANNGF